MYNDLISEEDQAFWADLCKKDIRRLEKLQTQNIGEGHFMDDEEEEEEEKQGKERIVASSNYDEDEEEDDDNTENSSDLYNIFEQNQMHKRHNVIKRKGKAKQEEEEEDDFDHDGFLDQMLRNKTNESLDK